MHVEYWAIHQGAPCPFQPSQQEQSTTQQTCDYTNVLITSAATILAAFISKLD